MKGRHAAPERDGFPSRQTGCNRLSAWHWTVRMRPFRSVLAFDPRMQSALNHSICDSDRESRASRLPKRVRLSTTKLPAPPLNCLAIAF